MSGIVNIPDAKKRLGECIQRLEGIEAIREEIKDLQAVIALGEKLDGVTSDSHDDPIDLSIMDLQNDVTADRPPAKTVEAIVWGMRRHSSWPQGISTSRLCDLLIGDGWKPQGEDPLGMMRAAINRMKKPTSRNHLIESAPDVGHYRLLELAPKFRLGIEGMETADTQNKISVAEDHIRSARQLDERSAS